MAVIEIENLRIAVPGGGAEVVKGIGLRIARGETVCLVGESGPGKSVTSLAAMGLLPEGGLEVTGGRIVVDGTDVVRASPPELRRLRASKVAMIFQEPMTALNPVMRVGDQIAEVLAEHTPLSPRAKRGCWRSSPMSACRTSPASAAAFPTSCRAGSASAS